MTLGPADSHRMYRLMTGGKPWRLSCGCRGGGMGDIRRCQVCGCAAGCGRQRDPYTTGMAAGFCLVPCPNGLAA